MLTEYNDGTTQKLPFGVAPKYNIYLWQYLYTC